MKKGVVLGLLGMLIALSFYASLAMALYYQTTPNAYNTGILNGTTLGFSAGNTFSNTGGTIDATIDGDWDTEHAFTTLSSGNYRAVDAKNWTLPLLTNLSSITYTSRTRAISGQVNIYCYNSTRGNFSLIDFHSSGTQTRASAIPSVCVQNYVLRTAIGVNALQEIGYRESNISYEKVLWVEISQAFNNVTVETSRENFTLRIARNTSIYPSVSAILTYNNTNYTAASTNADENTTFTAQLLVPLIGNAQRNMSFYWNILFTNSSGSTIGATSASYNQTVNTLPDLNVTAALCNDRAYNFTIIDEENFTNLIGTVDYNFRFGVGNGTAKQVFGRIENITSFYVCINSTLAQNWTLGEGEIQYRTTNYVDRRYYPFSGTILTNVTNNVSLHELRSAVQTSFKLEVEDTSLNPYVDRYSALLRWYPNLNQYRVVEMGKTDILGTTVMHVRTEDVDYRIAVYEKNGTIIKLDEPTRMLCLVNPCTYTLKVTPTDDDFTSFLSVQYALNYNTTSGIWTFTFSDASQRTTTMNLTIYRDTGTSSIPICSSATSGYVGALSCDTSIYTSGTLRAVAQRTVASPITIAQKVVNLGSTALRSTLGLWLSFLVGVPVAVFFAYISPVAAIIGGIIALIPSLYFGVINWAILAGLAVLGGIVAHFIKRV